MLRRENLADQFDQLSVDEKPKVESGMYHERRCNYLIVSKYDVNAQEN